MDILSGFFKGRLNPNYNYKVAAAEYYDGFQVTITLPKGESFCCGEPCCHFSVTDETIQQIKELLDYEWPNKLSVKLVVEDGAILGKSPSMGYLVEEEFSSSR